MKRLLVIADCMVSLIIGLLLMEIALLIQIIGFVFYPYILYAIDKAISIDFVGSNAFVLFQIGLIPLFVLLAFVFVSVIIAYKGFSIIQSRRIRIFEHNASKSLGAQQGITG